MTKSSPQKPETQSAAVAQGSPSCPLEHSPGEPTQCPALQSASVSQRSPIAPVLHTPPLLEFAPTHALPVAQSACAKQGDPELPVEQVPTKESGGTTQ